MPPKVEKRSHHFVPGVKRGGPWGQNGWRRGSKWVAPGPGGKRGGVGGQKGWRRGVKMGGSWPRSPGVKRGGARGRGGRYVLIIHFYVESGQKMIQFNIQFKFESKIFIQKIIQFKKFKNYSKTIQFKKFKKLFIQIGKIIPA